MNLIQKIMNIVNKNLQIITIQYNKLKKLTKDRKYSNRKNSNIYNKNYWKIVIKKIFYL